MTVPEETAIPDLISHVGRQVRSHLANPGLGQAR